MIYVTGIIQFFCIFYICIFEYKRESPAVFLWSTLLLMFGMMHLITSFVGDPEYNNEVITDASVFVIIFCLLYLLTRKVLLSCHKRVPYDFIAANTYKIRNKYNFYTLFIFLVFIIIVFMRVSLYIQYIGSIFNASWGNHRDFSAALSYFNSSQIYHIGYFVCSGIFVVLWIHNKRILALCSALLVIGDVCLTMNRIEMLPLLCGLAILFILKHRKINTKVILCAALAATVVIYIVYGLRVYRHYGTLRVFLTEFNIVDFLNRITLYIITGNGELGLRRVFYYFLSQDNNFENFGRAHSYIRMLLVYIPTQWSFGIKPPDFAQSMGAAIGMAIGGSTHPTLFGDCYANGGLFGVFLGVFWGIYVDLCDYLIRKQSNVTNYLLLYTLCSCAYVIQGRGSVYNAFVLIAWGLPLLFFIYFIFITYRQLCVHRT